MNVESTIEIERAFCVYYGNRSGFLRLEIPKEDLLSLQSTAKR